MILITAILAMLLQAVVSLTLQGNWTLIAIQGSSLSVPVVFSEYIFRESAIMSKINISTCNSLAYQVDIDQNDFWVDVDSERIDDSADCSAQDFAITQSVREAIRSVLTFSIIVDQLILSNPSSEPMLVFNRSATKPSQPLLNGQWMIDFQADNSTTYVMMADAATINVCNGASFKYNLLPPYGITVKVQSTGNCNQNVLQSIAQITYFKGTDGELKFYDSNVHLLASASFTSATNLPQNQAISSSSQHNAASTGFSTGNYILLLLYRRDLMRVKLLMTASSISLIICNKLTFNYTLGPSSSIAVTSSSVPSTQCSKANETIYYNYLTSAASYTIDSEGLITLSDSASKSIISLAPQ